ncbi:MAG: primosomal replication protein N [Burkholderiales bacterium]|nr:primosomal replication protein N [Burkholderiales bacterium]
MTNRVRLRAKLVARGDLRYTPAGVAVLHTGLSYGGAVVEAGIERQLSFELEAVAMGDLAKRLDRQALGTEMDIDGFLAPRSLGSRSLRLHITEFTAI